MEQRTSVIRRSVQARKKPKTIVHQTFTQLLHCLEDDPKTKKEVINSLEGELWKKAMEEEMKSLRENETWDMVTFPNGNKPIGSKWVFKKKMNAVGQVDKYKAQLVVKGYSQVEGVKFGEIFSYVSKLASIRLLMYLDTTFDLEIEQMDVKTTFLHADLEE